MLDDSTLSQARPLPLSQQLAQIVEAEGPVRLSFSELATQLQSRAWGGLLFIFATINLLPLPPGTSVFFAIPLLIVSAQMVFGRASPWFPRRIDKRGVRKQELQRLIGKIELSDVTSMFAMEEIKSTTRLPLSYLP